MERKVLIGELVRRLGAFVTEAHRGMSRAFDLPRVNVLDHVAAQGPVRPGSVSDALGMAPSSVTRHVQALEEAGHLRVSIDPDDARTCLLEVTATGSDELDSLVLAGGAAVGHVVAEWSDEDVATLTTLLDRMVTDWRTKGAQGRRHASGRQSPRWRVPPAGPATPSPTEDHDA